jgi:hypothetical protein
MRGLYIVCPCSKIFIQSASGLIYVGPTKEKTQDREMTQIDFSQDFLMIEYLPYLTPPHLRWNS